MFSNDKTIKNDMFLFNVMMVVLICLSALSGIVKESGINFRQVAVKEVVTPKPKMRIIMTTNGMKAIPATEKAIGNPTVVPKPLSKTELAEAKVKIDKAMRMSIIDAIQAPKQITRKGFDIKPRDINKVDVNSYKYKLAHEEPEVPMSKWDDFIADKAREYNVPVSLAFSIINLESDFDHKAVNSSSGATGLGQMLPSTAIHVAKMKGDYAKHKKIFGSDRNAKAFYAKFLKNPQNNVDYCVYYIGYLKVVHKTWFRAIKAYSGHYHSSNQTFCKQYGYKVQKYLIKHKSVFRLY